MSPNPNPNPNQGDGADLGLDVGVRRAKQARRTNTDILSSPAARAVLQIAAFEAHRKQLRILSYARVVELCLAELQGDRYEEQVGALEVVSALQRQVRDHHFSSANLSTLVLSTFDDSGKICRAL